MRRTTALLAAAATLTLALASTATALADALPATPTPRQHPAPIHVLGETTAWDTQRDYVGVFADPDIVYDNGRWFAYATNTSHQHLPTLVSTDLSRWRPVSNENGERYDPLPLVGSWVADPAGGGGLWAPAVARMGDGWTVAYSAQRSSRNGVRHNCIGLARGTTPQGPFAPVSDRPFECGLRSPMGVIDPDLYTDRHGRHWMLWKFSGITGQHPASIFIRQLNTDGTDWMPGSQRTTLLQLDPDGWEGNTIENPAMIRFRRVNYLFYSANAYTTDRYATGYAICDTVTGPCDRVRRLPLLSTMNTGHPGPGGATAFEHNRTLHLAYHAWEPAQIGLLRRLHVASLRQKRSNHKLIVKYPG